MICCDDRFPLNQRSSFGERGRDRDDCCRPKCCCGKCERCITMNASTGGLGPLPIITTPLTAPLTVVSTTIDTRCMCESDVLLNFSGVINLPVGAVATLNFQILRSNECGTSVPVGGTYTFAFTAAALSSESFSFQFFDSDLAPGIYTYTVALSTGSLVTVAAGVTITNAVLSALAVADE